MIHLKISKTKEHYYDVFDGMLPIATLLAKGAGIIELRPSEIFRKHNGFGVNEELLNDTTIPFKHVVIIFKGKNYHATREEFLEKGIEESAGLLYVISKYSVKSTWVKEELSMARVKSITQRGIYTIYPLLVDDVELPVSISQLKYVQNPGKSHTESGSCRTVRSEESTGIGIVPQVFGMERTALSFR